MVAFRSDWRSDWTCVQSFSAAAPPSLPSLVAFASEPKTSPPEMRSCRDSSICVFDIGTYTNASVLLGRVANTSRLSRRNMNA